MVSGAKTEITIGRQFKHDRIDIQRLKSKIRAVRSPGARIPPRFGTGTSGSVADPIQRLATQGDTMIGPIAFFPQVLTVATGVIDIGQTTEDYSSRVIVLGEGSVADDLDTILNAKFAGQLLFLQAVATTPITLKHLVDNIRIPAGKDYIVKGLETVILMFDSTSNQWVLVGGDTGLTNPMTEDLVMGDNSVIGLNAIAFTDIGGQIAVADDVAGFNFVTLSDRPFRFTPNATNILDITDAGLILLGGKIDLVGLNIDNVGTLEFQTANTTITSDIGGMIFSLPDAGDDYTFTIDTVDSLHLEKFFATWADTIQVYNEQIDPIGTPVAGDVWLYGKLDGGIAKIFYKQSDSVIVGPLGKTTFVGFTADADLVMGDFSITGLNALAFTDIGAQIAVADDVAGFNFVTLSDRPFRFTPNATNVLDITDAGIIMIAGKIDLVGLNIDNVGTLEFSTANITISSDIGGMNFSVPDATDDYTFTIDTVDSLVLEKFFANWGDTVQQYNERLDPAAPPAGDVFFYAKLDGGIAKLFYRQSDSTIVGPLGAGGGGFSEADAHTWTALQTYDMVGAIEGIKMADGTKLEFESDSGVGNFEIHGEDNLRDPADLTITTRSGLEIDMNTGVIPDTEVFHIGDGQGNPWFLIDDDSVRFNTAKTGAIAHEMYLSRDVIPSGGDPVNVIFGQAKIAASAYLKFGFIQIDTITVSSTPATNIGRIRLGAVSNNVLNTGITIDGIGGQSAVALNFYNTATPIARQVLAANPTTAQISTILEALGLTKFV